MSPTVDGLVRVQYRFLLNGSECEFHQDFTTDQEITVPFLQTTGAGLINWALTYLMPNLSHELIFVEVFMQSLDPAQEAEVSVTDSLPVAGSSSAAAEANQIAMVCSLQSAETSPSGKGRFYVPGWDKNNIAAGLFAASAVAIMDAALTALAAMSDSPALQWVIYSVKEDVANAVAAWVVRVVPGGLNKRRIGRGW